MEAYPMFPLFVPLAGKPIVIIGGGVIAARRAEKLRLFGARITLISPALRPELQDLAQAGEIVWEARGYRGGDLAGAVLAIAATDDRTINHAVALEAHAAQIPVSVADCPEESSFYFPAVMRGGGLVAGMVSENGKAHRAVREAAVKIRGMLNGKEDGARGQPGKPAGRDTGTDRDGCHPESRSHAGRSAGHDEDHW